MSEIIKTISCLPDLLPLKAATETQISEAQIQLCLRFADEYKEYLASYGAILADGIELTGIAKSEHRNVVFVTKKKWQLNSNVPHTLYVVEDTTVDGVVIWQDGQGTIYKTTPNCEPIQIAESLDGYLKNGR